MNVQQTDCSKAGENILERSEPISALGLPDPHELVVGGKISVPILDGSLRPYINLDNAASTPLAVSVKQKIDQFLEFYAAVHRGSGFKSQLASLAYEQARQIVAEFVGANLSEHTLIFVRNTTEGINRLAQRLSFSPDDVVITTSMEHHSNLLPWRLSGARVEMVEVDETGRPDPALLKRVLKANSGRVKLVAISGGSNVTGVIPDIHLMARMAHIEGAMLLIDAAQLAPHRPISMGHVGGLDSIDFLVFSGHKMYAPLGSGALIGRRRHRNVRLCEGCRLGVMHPIARRQVAPT